MATRTLSKRAVFGGAVFLDGQRYAGSVGLGCGDAGAGFQLDAIATEGPFQLLADFLVFIGNQARQQLDDRYVGTIHTVNVGEFDADRATAHDGDGCGHVFRHDGLAAGNDALAVNRQRRDAPWARAGGDNDVAGAYLR